MTIVGAGVVGCLTARELALRGVRVTVLERGPDICEGATKANSGIVHAGFDAKPGSLKARFNRRGNELFETLCLKLDVPFRRNGSLVLAFGASDEKTLVELQARGRVNGIETRILSQAELRAREPNVSREATAALWAPNGGITSPYYLAYRAAEDAANHGTTFTFNAPFDNFDGKSIVINCAGVHADEINNAVSNRKYHIIPRRGQYVLLDKARGNDFSSTIFQCPTKRGKGVLVSPTADGNLIVGPTAEDIGDKEDVATTGDGLEELLALARKTYPGLSAKDVITEFSGIRAHEVGGDFVIGEAPDVPGFFNALGIESPGLTAAPAIAECLANLVCGTEKSPIVCRCEHVTEAEVRAAIRSKVGARTLKGLKLRIRAQMGRCQGGFCTPRLIQILSEELGRPAEDFL